MGLFGSRKKIYVSSPLYNLAGDYSERTDYLKYLTFNGIMNPGGKSVGEHIVSGTLQGPRMNYQAIWRWASNNYTEALPEGGYYGRSKINPQSVIPFIPLSPGMGIDVSGIQEMRADYWLWAEDYVTQNHYDLLNTDWDADINETTHDITITFDSSTVTFAPVNYDPMGDYLITQYNETKAPASYDVVLVTTGPEMGPYASESLVPSTANYYLLDEIDHLNVSVDRNRRVRIQKTYSDSTPPEVTDTTVVDGSLTYDYLEQVFERFVEVYPYPTNPDGSLWRVMRLHIWAKPQINPVQVSETTITTEITPGVFETVVTTIWEDQIHATNEDWYYRQDEHKRDNGIRSRTKTHFYKMGSGIPELDALAAPPENSPGWFPFVPIRIDNKMIDEAPYDANIYPKVRRAWKKISGGKKVDKLIEQVADNPDLGDIDYAFITWGVPLNTISREGKQYIYAFFKELSLQQNGNQQAFLDYLAAQEQIEETVDEVENSIQDSQGEAPAPIVNPSIFNLNNIPRETELRLHCPSPGYQFFDFRLKFLAIRSEIITGQWKPVVKLRETKVEKGSPVSVGSSVIGRLSESIFRQMFSHRVFTVTQQLTADTYEVLTVIGAQHHNYVYGGKAVSTNSDEALDDNEDSGFLVPLNISILKTMPIIRANQLCTEAAHIVFNCYKIVKKKWYQTFLGAVLIAFVTMGIGAVFSGAGLAAAGGALGTNAAIGAMFGLSGVAGAIAGALANAIAAALIMHVVMPLLQKLGPLGAILGAVFGIMLAGGAFQIGGTGFDWSIFMRAENLIKLTLSTLDAVSLYVQQKTADILGQITDVNESLKSELRKIEELMYEMTGYRNGFDPMALTDVLRSRRENADTFLNRTLMTGTDIAELSHDMISLYAEANLNLENLLEK